MSNTPVKNFYPITDMKSWHHSQLKRLLQVGKLVEPQQYHVEVDQEGDEPAGKFVITQTIGVEGKPGILLTFNDQPIDGHDRFEVNAETVVEHVYVRGWNKLAGFTKPQPDLESSGGMSNFFKASDAKSAELAFNDLQTKLSPEVLQALTSGEIDYLPFVAVAQAPFHMGDWTIKPVVHEGQDGIVVTVNGEPYNNHDVPQRSAENLMVQLYRTAGTQRQYVRQSNHR